MKWLGVALLAVVVASTASADVWRRAVERGEPDAQGDRYERIMRMGDEWVEQATATDVSPLNLKGMVDSALKAYRQAADARPEAAEPWFRIADVLDVFYVLDSEDPPKLGQLRARAPSAIADLNDLDLDHAQQLVEAWNEAEKRAPLDPRFSLTAGERGGGVLFDRAILETKLIAKASPSETKRLLECAASDYEKILARADSTFIGTEQHERVVGNLAETYMMLGKLDRAIEKYRVAVGIGSQISTFYGLAVALDRADQPEEAIDLIVEKGPLQKRVFFEDVQNGGTFFVPEGEVFYYAALLEEAFGEDAQAIDHWRKFITSGAHPEFQPRAKEHLDALVAHRGPIRRLPPPPDEPADTQ